MGSVSGARQGGGRMQTIMIVGGGIFCLALIVVALMMRPGEQADESPEPSKEAAKKSQPTWNLALGNVVIVAPELGLTVKGAKNVKIDASRVATRIESQLGSLREFYRAESETHPSLMGGLLLELTLGPAGEVTQVKEISTRIANEEFRKSVIAAVKKWEFQDIETQGATILCPLLFVREGMDITTLVKWEKHLGSFDDKHLLGAVSAPLPAMPESAPARPSVEGEASETAPRKSNAPARTRAAAKVKKPAGKTAPLAATPAKDAAQAERGEM